MRVLTKIGWVLLLSGYGFRYTGYPEIALVVFGIAMLVFITDLAKQVRER